MVAIIIPFIISFATAIVTQFARVFTVESLKFLAWRAFILFIVFIALPIVFYNVATDLIFDLMSYAVSKISGTAGSPVIVQLTGLAGWIGNQINIQSSISIIMSAVATRFALSFIPFWGK